MNTRKVFKRFFPYLKMFLLGIVLAYSLNQMISCKKEDNPVEAEEETNQNVDVAKINDGAKSAETAFKSGDSKKVIEILTSTAKENFSEVLSNAKSSQLIQLGKALETKQLDVYSELYAEYTYQKDGVTFTAAFARQKDGSWKLMRF